ncbi:MAG: hypothetical protein QOJ10_720 [Chloroflexota bacterium]|jgi:uncharacterized protein YkwD|nr:hypothetical protein [Chloroflexota bacterium]
MKNISWLIGVVLFLAVALGTASVLRLHEAPTASLVADRAVASADQTALAGQSRAAVPAPAAPRVKAPTKAPAPVKVAAPVRASAPVRSAAIVIVSTQQALINQDRARYGLRPLAWSGCLASIAYSNAVRMANQGYISHTNGPTRDLGCGLGNHAGENVGYWSGGSLTQYQLDVKLNTMFMNSPDHRANILSPYYHYVGTAWKTGANGAHYIAVEFS